MFFQLDTFFHHLNSIIMRKDISYHAFEGGFYKEMSLVHAVWLARNNDNTDGQRTLLETKFGNDVIFSLIYDSYDQ